MGRLSTVLVLMGLGCSEKEVDCVVGDIGARPAAATIDGKDWLATDGTWSNDEDASGVNINLSSGDSRTINLIGTFDVDGNGVMSLIDDGDFPIEIDLSTETSYGGMRDTRNGLKFYYTNIEGGSGSMVIAGVEGDTLTACFEFDGISTDSEIVEVREGKLKIDLMDSE